jgi:hypothetical protein
MIRSLALAIGAAVLLAGCGGDDSGAAANPLAALATAVEKSADSESFRAKFSLRSDLEGEELGLMAVGTFTADSSRGRFEGRMDVGHGWMDFKAIALDRVMYMKSRQFPLPAGKEWFGLRDQSMTSLSPSQFAAALRDSDGVRNVGTQEIRGERATHFRGRLDLEKLAEESNLEIVERLRRSPGAKDIEFAVDMWVAQDGLPSRISADISMPGVAGSLEATTDILEYDVEVDVEKPPSDTVASP